MLNWSPQNELNTKLNFNRKIISKNDDKHLLRSAKPVNHINLSFSQTPEPDDDISVIANRYLLALAFRNLIENNCKYSSNHTSNVAIGVQQGLSVTFADKGIGMTPTEYRNLFRMLYRGSNHAEGGHGIGMALVQRIMVLHNASVDVQSKEGHGTKFIIKLYMKQHK